MDFAVFQGGFPGFGFPWISYLSTPGAHQHRAKDAKVQERTSGLRVDAARGSSVFGLVDMI